MSFSGVFKLDKARLDKIKEIKESRKAKTKGKKADKLTAKEKDELLLDMARVLGLID